MSETVTTESAEQLSELPQKATIFERMVAILADLPAIGKSQRNDQQRFMYRGHDDVLNALKPLLARHGVFIVPRVLERETAQRMTGKGSIMYEVNLHVEYAFYGLAGDSFTASAWGEGTDMGDKSTNKAFTMAFKNILAQSFAVSTSETVDTDGGTPEHTYAGSTRLPRTPRKVERAEPGSWALSDFNPSLHLDITAPRNMNEILDLAKALDPMLTEWIAQGVFAVYGADFKSLAPEQKNSASKRIANVLCRVRDELFGDGFIAGQPISNGISQSDRDFSLASGGANYRSLFAWAFDGVDLQGPAGFFEGDAGSDADRAAAAAALAAAEADGDWPDAGSAPRSGAQGHRGTAAPDE